MNGAVTRSLLGRLIVGVDLPGEFAVFFFIVFYLVSNRTNDEGIE